MKICKIDNSTSFGERVRLKNIEQGFKKMAKEIGCEPEMLAGATSVAGLASSAASLATGNYSGLAKVLPINVSIPLSTTVVSSAGYKILADKAKDEAKREAINAKRRGEPVSEDKGDADLGKVIIDNIKDRLKSLFKVNKGE